MRPDCAQTIAIADAAAKLRRHLKWAREAGALARRERYMLADERTADVHAGQARRALDIVRQQIARLAALEQGRLPA